MLCKMIAALQQLYSEMLQPYFLYTICIFNLKFLILYQGFKRVVRFEKKVTSSANIGNAEKTFAFKSFIITKNSNGQRSLVATIDNFQKFLTNENLLSSLGKIPFKEFVFISDHPHIRQAFLI